MHVPKNTITALVGVNGRSEQDNDVPHHPRARETGYRERHTAWRADVTRLPNTVKRAMSAPSSRIRPSTPCSLGTTSYGR